MNETAIIEVRGASGGDEASDFADKLLTMYRKYAERKQWSVALTSGVLVIKGHDAYSLLKNEAGVHCIQRIPPNKQKTGKIQTSTATVAVLEEPRPKDFDFAPGTLVFETMRGSGAGGQNRNKVESKVRVTHTVTKLTAVCGDERSQSGNRERALSVLRARVFAFYQDGIHKIEGDARRSQVKGGMRAERRRTYDVPEDRLIDRQSGVKLVGLRRIFNGQLDEVLR